ncbi:MAG: 5-formyltetrahydrofolate cyclo-ligase [Candidatus Omnitrophica bacterium]|nr:5-formyltetrahydrofolate cyclo-ligase [Candidatus Omnitrophota bacterium]
MNKGKIREEMLKLLKEQGEELRQRKSFQIKKKLFSQRLFLQSDTVMFYIAKREEVDTAGMIEDALKIGKKVVVPMILVNEKKIIPSQLLNPKKELEKGPYGIYQPKKQFMRKVLPETIDLVVIPGVAFDRSGNRLGRGGGYFDRFLSKFIKRNVPVFGLAFKFQILDKLPVLKHDIPVNKLIFA